MLKLNQNVVAVRMGRGSQYDSYADKLVKLTSQGVEDGYILTVQDLANIGITESTTKEVKNLFQGVSRYFTKLQDKIKAGQCTALDKSNSKVFKSIRLVNVA